MAYGGPSSPQPLTLEPLSTSHVEIARCQDMSQFLRELSDASFRQITYFLRIRSPSVAPYLLLITHMESPSINFVMRRVLKT